MTYCDKSILAPTCGDKNCEKCYKLSLNPMTNKKEKEKIDGNTKCCNAEIDYTGGGYNGEDIVPLSAPFCSKCGKTNPKINRPVGRPPKIEIPF